MDLEFQSKMKQRLLEMKEEVLNNLMAESQDFKDAVEDLGVKDLGDIASNDLDMQMLEVVSSQETKRLAKIEAALVRLENDKYGSCASCGKKISLARLDAMPSAVLCIGCKTKSENKKR